MIDHDAIVIGSGAGGMAAAVGLARGGLRVLVLEQHQLPGGYSQSFHLEGFEFSPGIHYVGGLGANGSLRRMYEGLGVANDLVFLELNPDGYDHCLIGSERFDIPAGRARYVSRLKERFPREAAGIDFFFDVCARMDEELTSSWLIRTLGDVLKLPRTTSTILRYGLMPLNRFLDSVTDDPLLRAILSIQAGDHAMAPSRVPTALHMALVALYLDGAYYPRGGAKSIPRAFIRELRRCRGEIRVRTAVDRILVENGRVLGVRLADGTELRANTVVSDADPGMTWGRLVAPEHQSRWLRRRLEKLRYSASALNLFLAVDADLPAMGFDSGNFWCSRTRDIDATYRVAALEDLSAVQEIPGLYLTATTLKDPGRRKDGLHTMMAIALISGKAFQRWEDSTHETRPAEYRQAKELLTRKILDGVDHFFPALSERVVFQELGTPLTHRDCVGTTEGNIYGTEKSLRNVGPFSFPIQTEIHGLYQVGASTIAPGLVGVTRSGLEAARMILGCSFEELLTARSQWLRIGRCEPMDSEYPPLIHVV